MYELKLIRIDNMGNPISDAFTKTFDNEYQLRMFKNKLKYAKIKKLKILSEFKLF